MTAKDLIVEILMKTDVIPPKYTGQVILHFGSGGLCDVECKETKGKLVCLQEKKVLDIALKFV